MKIPAIFISLLLPITDVFACHVNIFANENMKPKVYLENGQAKGILIDMMDYIGADINCKFSYHLSSWARAYKNMLDRKGGVIGLSFTHAREQLIDYSDVMYNEDILLVSHINSPLNYKNINDLSEKKLAASRSAMYSDEFEQAIKDNVFTFIADNGNPAHRLKLVAKERIDLAIISPGLHAFNSVFDDNPEMLSLKRLLYISPQKFFVNPNYLGFSKQSNHKAFLKKFNQSMKKARENGVFKAIEKKYLY
ncbi:substrate-binding periplasmic protein [Psychromonas sp. MME1]|uniref:substrate-binding periplasmic protein n=1 Tax=Psychromonas sp. MME1 TaxID=3231032 RepID=UPI0034E2542F